MSSPREIEQRIAAILEQCETSSLDSPEDRATVASKLAVAMYALVADEREDCARTVEYAGERAYADGTYESRKASYAASYYADAVRGRSRVG
jgi:hypothetical protein